jgi:CHAT domain-containing protein
VLLADSRNDLPAARIEVQKLATTLDVKPYSGAQATLARLEEARGAQLLYVATHGEATETGRALVLADARLTAAMAAERFADAAPEIVVLSGCATAQNLSPEPWDSLVAGFLAAGSRYVIATLRSVADQSAAEVMHAYNAQPASLPPPERLAAAQRKLTGTLPASMWASFTVWGGDCSAPSSANQTVRLAR